MDRLLRTPTIKVHLSRTKEVTKLLCHLPYCTKSGWKMTAVRGNFFFPTKLAHRQQKRMKEKCSLSNNTQRKSGISQCIMQNTQSQQLSSSETKWPSDKIHWPSTRKKHPRQTMTMIQHRSSIHCGWSLRNEIEGEGRSAVFALHCNGHYPKWMRRDNKNGPAVPVE